MTKARDYTPEARKELFAEIIAGVKASRNAVDDPEPDVIFNAGMVCVRYYDSSGRRHTMFGKSLENLSDRIAGETT